MRIGILLSCLALCLALPSGATDLELVINGEFELDLSEGWQVSSAGDNTTILRGTGYDHDPDYEVNMRKGTGTGHVKVWQSTPIPELDVDFSANLYASAYASGGAWVACALVVGYQDWNGYELGRTVIADLSLDCPWESTSTCHIIPAYHGEWKACHFNIAEELLNLPDVDPELVGRIEVCLAIIASDC